MKKVIAALVVVGLMSLSLTALAYDGSYPECLASPLSEDGRLTDTMPHRDDGALRIGTLGSFFIVSYNNTGERGLILGDVLSIEIPDDAIAVEACMDGTVTFTFASVDEVGETHTHEEAIDLIEFWIDWGYEFGTNFPI